MGNNESVIKQEIFEFYKNQSAEKTQDLENWLNSGSIRIPQPKSYYYFEDRKINNALAMAKPKKDSKILEIGCNLGQMTFVLAGMGYIITGFDLSEDAIRKAQMRAEHYKLKNISFEVQDAECYRNHNEEEFDVVFSFSAFRYFPDPQKALKESFKVLKKGGKECLTATNAAKKSRKTIVSATPAAPHRPRVKRKASRPRRPLLHRRREAPRLLHLPRPLPRRPSLRTSCPCRRWRRKG
jgi:2-polyprenyl-3-methyl-5-hydroxy-6-metoxy-1,4-benzoquinol methylase